MKWITCEEVLEAAETSDRAALACSIKHWRQLRDATSEDFANAEEFVDACDVYVDSCALCQRVVSDCAKCPLGQTKFGCFEPGSPWHAALNVWNDREPEDCRVRSAVCNTDRAWVRAASRMVRALEFLYMKMYHSEVK